MLHLCRVPRAGSIPHPRSIPHTHLRVGHEVRAAAGVLCPLQEGAHGAVEGGVEALHLAVAQDPQRAPHDAAEQVAGRHAQQAGLPLAVGGYQRVDKVSATLHSGGNVFNLVQRDPSGPRQSRQAARQSRQEVLQQRRHQYPMPAGG